MKLTKMLAAVLAAGVMAGCAVSAPGYEAGAEPVTTVPQVAATEAAEEQLEFGDIVYTVERNPNGSYSASRYAVVAHEGDVLIVTHAVSDTPEALRECLPEYIEGGAEVWQLDADTLYTSWEQAKAAAEELSSGR